MGHVSSDGDTLVLAGGISSVDGVGEQQQEASDLIFEYSGPSNTWYVWPERMKHGRVSPMALLVEQGQSKADLHILVY